MKLYLVSAIILLVIVYFIMLSYHTNQENFTGMNFSPKYCKDCNTLSHKGMNACLSCNNCGWCIDPNGYGTCVLGDNNGPFFADCSQYYFNGGLSVSPGGPGGQGGPGMPSWYQMMFMPWYGGYGTGSMDPAPSYMGNTFYNNNSPLRSARRWRPTGDVRTIG